MNVKQERLIWIDLEMTGLDPQNDHIIEIACIVTDGNLEVVAQGPSIAIYQPDDVLAKMGEWCQTQHTKSGLVKRIQDSKISLEQAEAQTLEFLQQHVKPGVSPMCGNTICQDRRFLYTWMPKLEGFFHYRNLDVSSVKELAKIWAPDVAKGFLKKGAHLAMDDIVESIEELRYYREHFFKLESDHSEN
tara:strand:+ start:19468 stop:20034 length:567 start_codon:yes stop_codon:yes gene_type:complete